MFRASEALSGLCPFKECVWMCRCVWECRVMCDAGIASQK